MYLYLPNIHFFQSISGSSQVETSYFAKLVKALIRCHTVNLSLGFFRRWRRRKSEAHSFRWRSYSSFYLSSSWASLRTMFTNTRDIKVRLLVSWSLSTQDVRLCFSLRVRICVYMCFMFVSVSICFLFLFICLHVFVLLRFCVVVVVVVLCFKVRLCFHRQQDV